MKPKGYIVCLAWGLLGIFAFPKAFQAHHVLTVHHHHTHCTAKNEHHFHVASDHCPIHDYVFAIPHKTGLTPQINRPQTTIAELIAPKPVFYPRSRAFDCFYRRGPPLKAHNI